MTNDRLQRLYTYTRYLDANSDPDSDHTAEIVIFTPFGGLPDSVDSDADFQGILDGTEFGYNRTGCSHEHDCCGCWFLSTWAAYPFQLGWILKRSWARNI